MISQQNEIRKKLHKFRKQKSTKVLQWYGYLTAKQRMFPDFIIVGSQRSGTTSLYHYLTDHPQINAAVVKEIHFFDLAYQKGLNWYRGNFPWLPAKNGESGMLTGEASPYYIFHPHAPARIARYFPAMKIIVLMRNPVDRAYSHYQNEVKLGFERLSFEEAVEQENSRINGEIEIMLRDEKYNSFNHRHYSYVSRGIYVEQLKNLMKSFPREQVHFIRSEDFFASPQKVLSQVLDFLSLPDWKYPDFKVHNRLQYAGMRQETRDRLSAYFEPFNLALNKYLGMDFGWNR